MAARRDDEMRLSVSGYEALIAIADARRAQVASEAMIPLAARLHQHLTDLLKDTDVGGVMVALMAR